MNRITRLRGTLVLAYAALLVAVAAPAYAASAATIATTAPVPSHAMVGARDLFGLTLDEARAAISTGTAVPVYNAFDVRGNGHTLRITSPRAAVTVNLDAMLTAAYSAEDTVTPFTLTPVYSITTSVVSRWANVAAKVMNNRAINAHRSLVGRKLYFYPERIGHTIYTGITYQRIRAAIASEIASPSLHPAAITAPTRTIIPAVTTRNIPKAILVVLGKFSLTLYNDGVVEKRYKVAIGMPGHRTPTGTWKIVRKVKNPSWHNPGSTWAKNMPAVIGPGPSNPLGTRALYLDAPGIRIHGTSKWWSIGTAASHGCMRMTRKTVEALYPRVPVGTVVYIVK